MMSIEFDRRTRASALIPAGPPEAQTIFKRADTLAYADGLGIVEAIQFGTEQAQRRQDPGFTPVYGPRRCSHFGSDTPPRSLGGRVG